MSVRYKMSNQTIKYHGIVSLESMVLDSTEKFST